MSDKIAFYNGAFYVDTMNYDTDQPVFYARPGSTITFTFKGQRYRGIVSDEPSLRDEDALRINHVEPADDEDFSEDSEDQPSEDADDPNVEMLVPEGRVPSDKNDDDSTRLKKLTEENDRWKDKVVAPVEKALLGTTLGYYHQATRKTSSATIYEFKSLSGGPDIEVHVIPNEASEPTTK